MTKRSGFRAALTCRGVAYDFGRARLLLVAGVLLLTSCSKGFNKGNSSITNMMPPKSAASSSPSPNRQSREEIKGMADQQGRATALDKGNFQVIYAEPKDAKYALIYESLKRSGAVEQLADELNAAVAIPEDVTVMFKQCGEVNARWSPKDHSIFMCYELMEDVAQRLQSLTTDGRELEDAVGGATMFVFFHEVGHCLFDLLKMPPTGREE